MTDAELARLKELAEKATPGTLELRVAVQTMIAEVERLQRDYVDKATALDMCVERSKRAEAAEADLICCVCGKPIERGIVGNPLWNPKPDWRHRECDAEYVTKHRKASERGGA